MDSLFVQSPLLILTSVRVADDPLGEAAKRSVVTEDHPSAGHISSSLSVKVKSSYRRPMLAGFFGTNLAVASATSLSARQPETGAQTPLLRDRPRYPRFPVERVRDTSCEACESQ